MEDIKINSINSFMKNAKGLAKNPLGIIALFISLIYGLACLVLGVSLSKLSNPYERLPLIWFIIIFPIIVLFSFIYLVVNHHHKLYAPGDFRNDETFINALNKNEIESKVESEIKEMQKSRMDELLKESEKQSKELQDTEIELRKNGEEMKKTLEEMEELKERYIKVEKWALDEYCLETHLEIHRNQRVSSSLGNFQLDGIARTEDLIYVFEIKYLTKKSNTPTIKVLIRENVIKLNKIAKAFPSNKRFIPVIIIVLDNTDKIEKVELLDYAKKLNPDIQIEIYKFRDLQEKYSEN